MRTLLRRTAFLVALILFETVALGAVTYWMMNKTANYCRARGYIGYSLGGMGGPYCIDSDYNAVKVPT